jgi:hypothetical protein
LPCSLGSGHRPQAHASSSPARRKRAARSAMRTAFQPSIRAEPAERADRACSALRVDREI